jgi:cytochrome c oxidase accessory protein FixG
VSGIYPSDVSGRYRRRRTWISGSLLVVFILLPWLHFGGHQAVLLDIWNGKFAIFGLHFWSHDAPILVFVFGGAAVLLAFVTSVWGRLWCGWACPQTVFVDIIFRRVERWVEGDAVKRRQLNQAPWSGGKLFKKTVKWSSYLLISLLLSHSFLAYFIGTEALGAMMRHAPSQNLGSFTAMAGMTAVVLFDFGWLREQFCTLICPYGRFQSVLMDEKSLAVHYDPVRGEPRRGEAVQQNTGDCVNCSKCVNVCPTGIDIRNGLQMECIACTACIDACDAVMLKVGKPIGLIRYSSNRGFNWSGFARPGAYLAVLSTLAGGLTWTLSHREPVEMVLIRTVGAPYEEIIRPGFDKEIVNHFKMDLLNQTFTPVTFSLSHKEELDAKGVQIVSAALPLDIKPGESRRVDLFIRFPFSHVKNGRGHVSIEATTRSKQLAKPFTKLQEVPLVGPLR